jgi:hypothetical protein
MTFYKLQVGRERRFIEGASRNDWAAVICPKDAGHRRAGRRVTPLYLDILSYAVVDFSRTMLSDIVITERAHSVLREAGLTGFEVQPARVEDHPAAMKKSLPVLWEMTVTGKGGPVHKASGVIEIERCEACGLACYSAFKHGIQVDESTYDGSDFFVVREFPKYVLITSRARAVIERAKLTNVKFIEATKVKWPEGIGDAVSVEIRE